MAADATFRSPTRLVACLLAILIFCLSTTITGLVGRSLYWYWENYLPVQIYFDAGMFWDQQNQTAMYDNGSWTNDLAAYDREAVEFGDSHAMLVAAVFGLVLSLAVLALTIRGRSHDFAFHLSGRRTHHLDVAGPRVIFYLDSCLALVTFIAACIAWVKYSKSADDLDWYKFPPWKTPWPVYTYQQYQNGGHPTFTLECWDCMLYFNMVEDPKPGTVPYSEMKSVCYTAKAARIMILALLVLVLVKVTLKLVDTFLVWRRGNILARADGEDRGGKDVDMMSLRARSGRSGGDRSSYVSGAQTGEDGRSYTEAEMRKAPSVVELPADRTSKFEMGNESAVQEMYAESSQEIGSDIPAWELDGRGKS